MKNWVKKMSIPLISMAMPFFAVELFFFFILFNLANKLEDIPALLPLNVELYQ